MFSQEMSASLPIAKFWSWFIDNLHDISEAYDCGDSERLGILFAGRLPKTVCAINWEIGPYHHPERTLILSPTVRENLPLTKKLVSEAPAIPGWHFLPAKPPKVLLSLQFELPGASACADEWRYILYAYPDGLMELEILIPADAPFPKVRDRLICEILVDSLIGEETRLNHIVGITPLRIDAFSALHGIAVTSMKDQINKRLCVPKTTAH